MIRRIKLLQLFFCLWFFLLFLRLTYWQIIKASVLGKTGLSQYDRMILLPAQRGEIRSSDNYPLVGNGESYMSYIEPEKFELKPRESLDFYNLLPASDSARKIISEASRSRLFWMSLAHGISPEAKARLEELKIPGLGFEYEPVRTYPEGTGSAYLTGFVGKNEMGGAQGYFGLEGFYDRVLSGKPGKLLQELDALGKPMLIGSQDKILPQPGQNLITSIDRTIQHLAYQHLTEGLAKYQAKSGTVSVMDVQTGNILAMVSLPGYDPKVYTRYPQNLYPNPIISEGYEPGSTFKTIVMASALDAGVVIPDTVCETCTGPQSISGYSLKNYNDRYYPKSTMTDVILHSDNVGMIFVGRKLGKSQILSYVRKFGFGKLSGIDLQEEDTPEIRPDDQWQDVDWATVAFGQGIAVTRLQMLTAVNAIASGGNLFPPRLVTGIETDGQVKKITPSLPVRVISQKAAATMTAMMINGVNNGEVRYYKVPGYTVAGKTGTAQVPIAGHYDEEKLIASFVGFAPAENPEIYHAGYFKGTPDFPLGQYNRGPALVWHCRGDIQIPPSPAKAEVEIKMDYNYPRIK